MIIYKSTNLDNNKSYIGQTVQELTTRIVQHKSDANRGLTDYFHRAIAKYGIDTFEWKVLRFCDYAESLNAFEQYYILLYDTNNRKFGYNLQTGGGDYRHANETKKKIGKKSKGRYHSDISKEKNRQSHIGKPMAEDTKKKLSKSISGKNHWNWGGTCIHTEETKKLISDKAKKRWQDPVYIKKMLPISLKNLSKKPKVLR